MSKKKTNEEYVEELKLKNPTVEVVGKYVNAQTKIVHHCLKHDVYWEAAPGSLLRGCGCVKCKNERIGISNKKSEEQYIKEVNQINPNIKVIGRYINSDTPILHKCNLHNITWSTSPISILHGHGCKECGREKNRMTNLKNHDDYVIELKNINPNIVIKDKYINALTSVLHQCLICGYEWMVTPANTLSGKGCPKCAGNARKTHKEYVNEVSIVNPDIEVVGQYVGAKTPILHRCKIDNYIWNVAPSDILNNKGCPQCRESKMERQARIWLDNHNILYERYKKYTDCIDHKHLSYDFYLPDYNTNIECQGIQHYKPVDYFGGEQAFKIQQRHDAIKRQYCLDNNIELLEIPYWENVENTLNNFLFN